jgi:hypothetical protein
MLARAVLTGSFLSLVPFLAHLASAQTSGTFNFLTYNVAGLPAFLNGNDESGDKATNAGLIGGKLSSGNFDVVHMQEVRSGPLALRVKLKEDRISITTRTSMPLIRTHNERPRLAVYPSVAG